MLRTTDALRLCSDGGYEKLPFHRAVAWLQGLARREMADARGFVAQAGLCPFRVGNVDDPSLLTLLRAKLQAREIAVIRACESRPGDKSGGQAEQRRLLRQIEALSRQGLSYGGRRYRLVSDVELDRLRDRDRFEVVRHQDAVEVLHALAGQSGGGGDLAKLLAKAAEMLTKDWRAPFTPDGLVLLRRIVALASSGRDDGPALTPSQLKNLRQKDWIEIELVDQDGEPYSPHHRLELAESLVQEGDIPDDGLLGLYEIESGTYKLILGEVKLAPAVAQEVQEETEEGAPEEEEPASADETSPLDSAELAEDEAFEEELEPEVVPTTLRFRLLDLAGKPISGAAVTVAGSPVTTGGDGMVEAEVSQGPQSISATLPDGDIALSVGGLDPQNSSDDGFKLRLFNMGFLWDTNVGPSDDEMVIALQDFQAEYKLKLSGQLDDPTKAKLVEVYGC